MPKISVIVPVYNVEKYLRQCVESILNQTFRDFELILIDDGSPDQCGEICDQYASSDPRVKVIHQSNGGLSAARNAGLDVATGEYLAFVDSDDFIHKEMLEILYCSIVKTGVDITVCEVERVSDNGLPESVESSQRPLLEDGVHLNKIAFKGACFSLPPWQYLIGKLYNRKIFSEVRFPQGKVSEDLFIFPEIMFKISQIWYTSEKLYYYRNNPNSIMGVMNKEFLLCFAEGSAEVACFLEANNQIELLNLFIERLFHRYYVAISNISNDNDKETQKRAKYLKKKVRRFLYKYKKDARLSELFYFEFPTLFKFFQK